MTPDKCFFGCTNVRFGTRIIAVLDFWIGVILLIKVISFLNPYNDFDNYFYNQRQEQMERDFIIFNHLFIIFLFLYINYYLKNSTYIHSVHKIYQWLAINTLFLSFHILSVAYITVKNSCPKLVYYATPVCVVHVCQIYVVKCFYDHELDSLSSSINNAAQQNTSSNRSVHANPNNAVLHNQGLRIPTVVSCNVLPRTAAPQVPQYHLQPPLVVTAPELQYHPDYYNLPAYSPAHDQRRV